MCLYDQCIGSALQWDEQAGDSDDVVSASKIHKKRKKKRKKELQSLHVETLGESSTAEECEASVNEAEEELKELNLRDESLSDETALKRDSKPKKKKKKRKRDGIEPQEDVCSGNSVEKLLDTVEIAVDDKAPKKRKSKKKKRSHDDHETVTHDDQLNADLQSTADPQHHEVSKDKNPLTKSPATDIAPSSGDSDVVVDELMEEMHVATELTQEEQETVSSDHEVADDVKPLMPLGRAPSKTKAKKSVQRQLPQWITEADIIQDDITEQSQ